MKLENTNTTGIAEPSAGESLTAGPETLADRYSARLAAGSGCFTQGVRESMAALPKWLQPVLTYITGKPLPHQASSLAPRPLVNFVLSVMAMVFVIGGNLYGFSHSIWLGAILLPPAWIITTGLLRKFQVVFGHHAAHRLFFRKNALANQFMLDILTTLPLAQNGVEYRRDHFSHHNRSIFTTYDDPDATFLYKFGFRRGKSISELRRVLWMTLASPRFHLTFLIARFRSNFVNRPLPWRLVSMAWTLLLTLGLCQWQPWWQVALVVWFPYLFLYNASALLQFLTEHAWLVSPQAPKGLGSYADRCWGRFLGTACPSPESVGIEKFLLWTRWWLDMLCLHAPVRMGVLVGDLPAHDWHHLCGFLKQDPGTWPTAIFERQAAIDSGHSMGMESRELWGLPAMLNEIFSALAAAHEHTPQLETSRSDVWPTTTTTGSLSR